MWILLTTFGPCPRLKPHICIHYYTIPRTHDQ